jgi:hypothetical protein
MANIVSRTEPIWLFGKLENFPIYSCGVALAAGQYAHKAGVAVTHGKYQIVTHSTDGNNTGLATVTDWNRKAAANEAGGAHYVVERAQDRSSAAQAYSDVVEVVPSDTVVWQAEILNTGSIGIEVANVCTEFTHLKPGDGQATPDGIRPKDKNGWLHFKTKPKYPNSNIQSLDFQAYQNEQTLALILLLRSLCMKHRIPRRFLGDTIAQKMQVYWPSGTKSSLSQLMRFRGLLSHMNCSDRECSSPALHRNRLFRGIIDEWWLPVELDGTERPYYMGPFDPQPNMPSFFRWNRAHVLQKELFHDADPDALQDTHSYYDLDKTQMYYATTEDPALGGTFPIGANKLWHGGVHFAAPNGNPKVYAAASGTIVAARLGSNEEVENDASLGSQRFVLIRHTLHWKQEASGSGRIDYQQTPTFFFTLYMHLAKFKGDLANEDTYNPPWFNYWLRHRAAAADPNAVFCPDAPVSVGDWLGECGLFRGKQMLHFEVMSQFEMTEAPWDDPKNKIVDNDSNVICDSSALNNFVAGANVSLVDILQASRKLRAVKSFHKSEWALTDESGLIPYLPQRSAATFWKRLKFLMWVQDALKVCPDLSTQLCDATGMMWQYHPITFMEYANQLVVRENGAEPDDSAINVKVEDAFITEYVSFSSGAAAPEAADAARVEPFPIPPSLPAMTTKYPVPLTDPEYLFTRLELACRFPAPHDPAEDPPKRTKFHISLLNALQTTRISYDSSITVRLSYVCPAHNKPENRPSCVQGTNQSLASHGAGLAVDIRPGTVSQDTCKKLWTAATQAAAALSASCSDSGGMPSHADLKGHVRNLLVSTLPGVAEKLKASKPLTRDEINGFAIHMELAESTPKVLWFSKLLFGSKALDVRMEASDVVGTFTDGDDAKAANVALTAPVSKVEGYWDSIIKRGSRAKWVEIRSSDVVGVFDSVGDAQAEAARATDAWSEVSAN